MSKSKRASTTAPTINPEDAHSEQLTELPNPDNQDSPTEKVKRKSPLELRRYTKQIWLAGLGAFSRAESENDHEKGLFDSLVKVGEELEAKTNEIAEHTTEKVTDAKERALGYVSDAVDRVEKLLDQPLARISSRHNKSTDMVSDEALQRLSARLDQIEQTQQQVLEQLTHLNTALKTNKK